MGYMLLDNNNEHSDSGVKPRKDVADLCSRQGTYYCETSAKTGHGVQECIQLAVSIDPRALCSVTIGILKHKVAYIIGNDVCNYVCKWNNNLRCISVVVKF